MPVEGQMFEYIEFSKLMVSIEDDFHKWSDAGLVDASKYIKVIRECNEKLGIRIYRSKSELLFIEPAPDEGSGHRPHGRANLPPDFYKAEMALALHKRFVNSMLPIGPGITQVMRPPTLDQLQSGEITNMTGPCCIDATGPCSWLVKTPLTQLQVQIEDVIPLEIFEGSHSHFVEYSPNRGFNRSKHRHGGQYIINIQEGFLEVPFLEGQVMMTYLADMKNEKGEDIIPFHPRLNEYYEWAVKARILQNILYNAEADVAQLYKDAKAERNFAFNDAINFVMGKRAKEWQRYERERSRRFYHQYYSIFMP